MVGARGFEPPTSRSRTVRATRLRYAPIICWSLLICSREKEREGRNVIIRMVINQSAKMLGSRGDFGALAIPLRSFAKWRREYYEDALPRIAWIALA